LLFFYSLNFNKYYQSDIEQQYQAPRQPLPLTPQPEEPKIALANHYVLPTNQPSSLLSSRFTSNYNAKPRVRQLQKGIYLIF